MISPLWIMGSSRYGLDGLHEGGKDGMTDTWLERVSALSEMNDWQGLLNWCRKRTKSEPENADAWNSLGIAYFRLSRHNDAIEAFRQTIRIDPKNAVAWFGVGTVYALTN
jgi:cytochrome c-type biogenesis protein CcmH/NrfG